MFDRKLSKGVSRALVCAFGIATVAILCAVTASAQTLSKKTTVTFNMPVEIPGVSAQVLPAGYASGSLVYGRVSQMEASRRFGRNVIAATRHSDLAEGDPVGRLEVPRLRISVMVLQGVEDRTLVAGAGHVPGTPSPGSDGNVVIAAHRDTFFRTLERVVPGDRIQIDTATWRHAYIVESTEVVDPDETRVMESRGRRELTLITCYPFYFVGPAPRRFVVHARPVDDETVVRIAAN